MAIPGIHLSGVYTQAFSRVHQRVGHVFQGRYKAILVEKEAHLLELARYVVLNPVRAGMVAIAGEWPWSSYRALVAKECAPDWLATRWILTGFGETTATAVPAYVRFVTRASCTSTTPWENVKTGPSCWILTSSRTSGEPGLRYRRGSDRR